MGWKIKRDYLAERDRDSDNSRAGFTVGVLNGDTFTFRLRDGDDIVYFAGEADAEAAQHDDHSRGLYGALGWAQTDAGCTDLQVKAADAVRLGLTSQAYVNGANLGATDWVSIYG